MKGTMNTPNSHPRLAVSLVVNIEEGSEYSVAFGDKGPEPVDEFAVVLRKPVRNLPNESNYLYGVRAGLPRIERLLASQNVRCTWAAAAEALRPVSSQMRQLISLGHEVCAHGDRWIHQHNMDLDTERAFIESATQTITKLTGTRPVGWLSRYLFTENTRSLLAEQEFKYHMDDYSDDKPRIEKIATTRGEQPIVVLPYALDTNDMKLWLSPAYTPVDWLDYAVDSFNVLYSEALDDAKIMSIGVHLRIMGRPGRIGVLEKFLRHVQQHPHAGFATRAEIAQWASEGQYERSGQT